MSITNDINVKGTDGDGRDQDIRKPGLGNDSGTDAEGHWRKPPSDDVVDDSEGHGQMGAPENGSIDDAEGHGYRNPSDDAEGHVTATNKPGKPRLGGGRVDDGSSDDAEGHGRMAKP